MRIHSIRQSVASIFCTPNQGKKEEYIFASKVSYTVLRTSEQGLLSQTCVKWKKEISDVIAITHLFVDLY